MTLPQSQPGPSASASPSSSATTFSSALTLSLCLYLLVKILVAGGCGYIGSHALVELTVAGHDPVSIDDNSRSSESLRDGIEEVTGKRARNYHLVLASWSVRRESQQTVGMLQA